MSNNRIDRKLRIQTTYFINQIGINQVGISLTFAINHTLFLMVSELFYFSLGNLNLKTNVLSTINFFN